MEPKDLLDKLLSYQTQLDNTTGNLDDFIKFIEEYKNTHSPTKMLTIKNIEKIRGMRVGSIMVDNLQIEEECYFFNCITPGYPKGTLIKLDRNENQDGKYPMTESNFRTTFYIDKDIIKSPKTLLYKMEQLVDELPF